MGSFASQSARRTAWPRPSSLNGGSAGPSASSMRTGSPWRMRISSTACERRFAAVEVLSSRVIVYPEDFARTVAWYDDVLGLARYREFGAGGRITGVVYFLGGGFLEVSSHGEAFGAADGSVRLWVQVRDVDAELERVAAAGATVLEPSEDRPWGLREAWVADPDGLRICLVQVPEDHPLRRRT